MKMSHTKTGASNAARLRDVVEAYIAGTVDASKLHDDVLPARAASAAQKDCHDSSAKGWLPIPVWLVGQFAGSCRSGFTPSSAP